MLLMLVSHGHSGVRKVKRQGSDAADALLLSPVDLWCFQNEKAGI